MKRENLKKIIKLRSCWRIDKRRGNYKLPSGERLSNYLYELVESQMKLDKLGIRENGELCFCEWIKEENKYILMPGFEKNEYCTYEEMERRIKILINEFF